ncbi:MAG: class I SAM-dependent methyltransferase [Clostridiales Family XIII bacterium]|jgi:SAM-dependent methyltransferase|nr:class I SAM-dependent methyltransferase [Clostridiales Family XIII bacterium]
MNEEKKHRHHGHRPPLHKMPLINWEALMNLAMRPFPGRPPEGGDGKGAGAPHHHGPGRGIGGWDNEAPFYSRMVQMEKNYTLKQLDLLEVAPEDTVLDVCCGPGRLVVPLSKRAARVTGLDASPVMLELLQEYAKAEGDESRIDTILMDWEDKDEVRALGAYDVVVTSRSAGLFDIPELVRLARKWVMCIIWANDSPSIPQVVGALFEGTREHGAPPFHFPQQDRRLGNNILYNRVYDMGFDPNVRIIDDGWERVFASREEAYAELLKLGKHGIDEGREAVFRANCDAFLTDQPDGAVKYFAPTKSMVIWWNVEEFHRKRAERKAEHCKREERAE